MCSQDDDPSTYQNKAYLPAPTDEELDQWEQADWQSGFVPTRTLQRLIHEVRRLRAEIAKDNQRIAERIDH